jgi:ubiquinone/menaquinone biosynthesis C-methylase UbiE
MAEKYGESDRKTWPDDIRKGLAECFRVLKPDGVLIFKWNETDILLREVLALTLYRPLFGHPSGKASKTHWVAFTKSASTINPKDAAKPREVV